MFFLITKGFAMFLQLHSQRARQRDSFSRLADWWPAALIGAIIGEWFGAPRGLGILIINAMQNFQIVLLWCAVLLAVGASLLIYGLLTLLERAAYARFG